MTDRQISSQVSGPIALDLTMNIGTILITVDPAATRAGVRLSTEAASGPSAEAIRDARVGQVGHNLKVVVPDLPGAAGMGSISVGGNTVTFSGGSGVSIVGGNVHISGAAGRVFVNGREVTPTGQAGDALTPITATVTLPAGSEVLLSTRSAQTSITGELARLDFEASSGSLVAQRVGEVDAVLSSGSLRIGEVTGTLAASLSSGNVQVDAYSGSDARLNLTSGNVTVHATPASQGRFAVSMTSGNGRITGAGHLSVRRHVTSGHLHIG